MKEMHREFWEARWAEGRIGFHQGRPNELLERHAAVLDGRRRVLVPLSGKSVDLRLLAERGHDVVGIELVRAAVEAFFEEQGIEASEVELGPYRGLTGGGVTLLAGDFFEATRDALGHFDAIYDRAALVALPRETRASYAAHCQRLLGASGRVALIAFAYDPSRMEGPPFSVDDAEVRLLYAPHDVRLVEERLEPPPPHLSERGLGEIAERLYVIDLR
jgi:thiopurine S-methyltransferase